MIEKLIEEQKFKEALDLLVDKTDEESMLQRTICYLGLKKYDDVIEYAEKVLHNEQNKFYYDVLSLYVVALVESNRNNEAIAVLESELSMPFVPSGFEPFLRSTYERLVHERDVGKKDTNPYDLYSDEKINELLETSLDLNILGPAVAQVERRNIRNFLTSLQTILKNPKLPNYLKTVIIELLRNQNVNQTFIYKSEDLTMEVEPTSLSGLYDQVYFKDLKKLVDEKLGVEDVSFAKVAMEVLTTVLAGVYPLEVSSDEYLYYLASIEAISHKMFNQPFNLEELGKKYDLKYEFLEKYYQKALKLSALL